MKKLLLIVALAVLVLGCENNTTTNIPYEYQGKWEVESFRFASNPNYDFVPPCTLYLPDMPPVNIISMGYDINSTEIKIYNNGENTSTISNLSIILIQINGDNAMIILAGEIDNCKKVTKFSWE